MHIPKIETAEKDKQPYSFNIDPEWLTVPQACEFVHMGKTSLYSYLDINGGKIRTSNPRKRNCTKGKRLINFDSLRAFIESFVEEVRS
jgi:hypothetical protein